MSPPPKKKNQHEVLEEKGIPTFRRLTYEDKKQTNKNHRKIDGWMNEWMVSSHNTYNALLIKQTMWASLGISASFIILVPLET